MHKLSKGQVTGSMIAILQHLESELNFNSELLARADMMWGSYDNETDSWNGMMSSLLADEADMILASYSFNLERYYSPRRLDRIQLSDSFIWSLRADTKMSHSPDLRLSVTSSPWPRRLTGCSSGTRARRSTCPGLPTGHRSRGNSGSFSPDTWSSLEASSVSHWSIMVIIEMVKQAMESHALQVLNRD